MKLKSSNKSSFLFLSILVLVTILLLSLKVFNFKKETKYLIPPEFEQKTSLDFIQLTIKEKHYNKLKKKRDLALSIGVLETADTDYVPATITFNGLDYKAEIRLKGDLTDHLEGDKWSFRVKLNDDKTILGMRKFSIHHPKTRGFINEWLYHKAIKSEGLIGLRYGFLEGAIHIKKRNSSKYINKEVGIYAIEETFDKRTIESNGRKESVILKFAEDYWWQEVKKSSEVGFEYGYKMGHFMKNSDRINHATIHSFSQEKVMLNPEMNKHFTVGRTLLENLRSKNTTIDKVFDVKKLALQNALLNLFGGIHGNYYINVRFYYNPITSKLEPIAFDGNSGPSLKKYAHFLFSRNKKDTVYLKELSFAINKVSNPKYLNAILEEYKEEINYYKEILSGEFQGEFLKVDNIRLNQQIMNHELVNLTKRFNISNDELKINERRSERLISEDAEKQSASYFRVKIRAKVLLDDKFRLLYTSELNSKFSANKIVFTNVKGSDDFQTITFALPKSDIYPSRLRFDFPNRSLKGIIIQSIQIEHNENKLLITSSELEKYFHPNNYIKYGKGNSFIKFINEKGKDYPYIVSRKPLNLELIKFNNP